MKTKTKTAKSSPKVEKVPVTVERPKVFIDTHKDVKPVGGTYEHSKGISRKKVTLPIGVSIQVEYGNKTHTVKVSKHPEKEGKISFLYQGKYYNSLSAIAGLITGHPTSGPNFFGLGWGTEKYRFGNLANKELVEKHLLKTK
jgi:hypothetical protein